MGEPITYVGIDAHKRELQVAMLIGDAEQPIQWTCPTESRALERLHCHVIAPSLIPQKPGERVKTNRRDARKLARLLRGGLLTIVHPPTPAQEAVRDLGRARDDARRDLMRCRHRLSKLLLRRGLHYHGRNWSRGHTTWLNQLRWDQPADCHVITDYRCAIGQLAARLAELDRLLREIAATAIRARGGRASLLPRHRHGHGDHAAR
ncbi:MAG TPA: hypothetical protein VH436_00910 [Vicinamibacterales bacterium]